MSRVICLIRCIYALHHYLLVYKVLSLSLATAYHLTRSKHLGYGLWLNTPLLTTDCVSSSDSLNALTVTNNNCWSPFDSNIRRGFLQMDAGQAPLGVPKVRGGGVGIFNLRGRGILRLAPLTRALCLG